MVDYSRYNEDQGPYIPHAGTGVPYGTLPERMLAEKFEHSGNIMGPQYYDYSRELLKDKSPDKPIFAYEEPRRSYSSMGFLNVLHRGGRGHDNYPAHPEINLELTETEPRRIFTDPDFRKLNEQSWSRGRFKKMYPGNDNHTIPGGNFHPNQINDVQSYYFNVSKPRLRIFSTAFNGRQVGAPVVQENKSKKDSTIIEQSYEKYLKENDVRHRKTAELSNITPKNSRWYTRHTTDHKFLVAKYGQNADRVYLSEGIKKGQLTTDADFVESLCFAPMMGKIMCEMASKAALVDTHHMRGNNEQSRARAVDVAVQDFEAALYKTMNDMRFLNTYDTKNKGGVVPSEQISKVANTKMDGRRKMMANILKTYGMCTPYIKTSLKNKTHAHVGSIEKKAKNISGILQSNNTGITDTVITVRDKTLTTKKYKAALHKKAKRIKVNTEQFGSGNKNTIIKRTPMNKKSKSVISITDQNQQLETNKSINHFSGRRDIKNRDSGQIRKYIDEEKKIDENI